MHPITLGLGLGICFVAANIIITAMLRFDSPWQMWAGP